MAIESISLFWRSGAATATPPRGARPAFPFSSHSRAPRHAAARRQGR